MGLQIFRDTGAEKTLPVWSVLEIVGAGANADQGDGFLTSSPPVLVRVPFSLSVLCYDLHTSVIFCVSILRAFFNPAENIFFFLYCFDAILLKSVPILKVFLRKTIEQIWSIFYVLFPGGVQKGRKW